MLAYNLDMQAFGIPGLTFMTRYGKGTGADYSNANSVYMRRDAAGDPLTDQRAGSGISRRSTWCRAVT